MDKDQFATFVFSRIIPDNFTSILSFDSMPRMAKESRQHMFISGLCLHALDNTNKYDQHIPHTLFNAEFYLRELIRNLSVYFDTFVFRPIYVHPTVCFLRKEFTTFVKRDFLQRPSHSDLFSNINQWLDNIVNNQQKQRVQQQKKNSRLS